MVKVRNYVSPAHDQVRAHLADLVTTGMAPHVCAQLRGLFMPGPDAWELPHLAAAGILGTQMTGVEWNSAHGSYMRQRAYPFPIIETSLEEYVLRRPQHAPFDFILLDFDGGYQRFANDIVGCVQLLGAPIHPTTFSVTYHLGRDELPLVQAASLGYGMLMQLVGEAEALTAHDLIVQELRRIPFGRTHVERMHRALRELALVALFFEGLVRSATTPGARACAVAWSAAATEMRRRIADEPLRAYRGNLPFPRMPHIPEFHNAVDACYLPRWVDTWFRCTFTSPPIVRMQTLAMRLENAPGGRVVRPLRAVVRAALRDLLMTPTHVFDVAGNAPIPLRCRLCDVQ
ncbi:hypothetical protein HY632_02340 [Candidatus Uhrbacteria bacterium]|nr:hypothetical protein [Candidatus Uhrbacteria bacterium]